MTTEEQIKRSKSIIEIATTTITGAEVIIEMETERVALLEERLKEEQREAGAEKMYLEVDDEGDLCVMYKGSHMGFLTSSKYGHFLNDIELYNQWYKDGCPVDLESEVEWKDGVYALDESDRHIFLRRTDILEGLIFDYTEAVPCTECYDDNVLRTEATLTPVCY